MPSTRPVESRRRVGRAARSALVLGPVLLACCSQDTPQAVADAGTTQARDAGQPEVGALEAGADAEAPDRIECPRVTDAGCAPVRLLDTTTLVQSAINMPAAFMVRPELDEFLAIGSHYVDSSFLMARSVHGQPWEPASALPFAPVSEATGAGRRLYFTGQPTSSAVYGTWSSLLTDTGFAPAEKVTLTGSPVIPSWPHTALLPDGRVLLAFVESQKRAFLAVSDATQTAFQVSPAPITTPAPLRGVLAHVGVTAGGRWVFTHQTATAAWLFTSNFQLSEDGTQWSEPQNVQPDFDNVHDLCPLTRHDSGADFYYLHAPAPDASFFSIFRRRVAEDGTLGEEQRVTDDSLGHVEKPQARRMPDGRVALMFARRISDEQYDLCITTLEGDAAH